MKYISNLIILNCLSTYEYYDSHEWIKYKNVSFNLKAKLYDIKNLNLEFCNKEDQERLDISIWKNDLSATLR
jgi:hypothetical protein